MAEREPLAQFETGIAFWDTVIEMAAEDELIRGGALSLLISDFAKDHEEDIAGATSTEADLYGQLGEYLGVRYGLPESFLDEVLNRAELSLQMEEAV